MSFLCSISCKFENSWYREHWIPFPDPLKICQVSHLVKQSRVGGECEGVKTNSNEFYQLASQICCRFDTELTPTNLKKSFEVRAKQLHYNVWVFSKLVLLFSLHIWIMQFRKALIYKLVNFLQHCRLVEKLQWFGFQRWLSFYCYFDVRIRQIDRDSYT